ncbi:MAG TPA: DNA-formamidopyrimidine glycosylase family protein [Rubrobacter sp.]|nr:DNA-formamidopyrimidine glycosylase family protein [Rubrobacter sp.]
MPELPELEVFKRYVDSTSLHQDIEIVEVKNGKILGGVSTSGLKRGLEGRKFESTRRHGKHLFVELDKGPWLLLHFGMTGGLKYYRDTDEEPAHARVLISFRNGYRLAFDDQRLFGKVDLIEDPDGYVEEHKLGPDPLDLDFPAFRKRLEGRRGEIKATLMNQQVFAGIGNIYSDEILFQVRLHPKTSVGRLDESSLHNLHEQTRRVLRAAIERGAEPGGLPDSVLLLDRQEGADCPRGNGKVQKTKAAGRTAYYCPTCQPRV